MQTAPLLAEVEKNKYSSADVLQHAMLEDVFDFDLDLFDLRD